MCCFDDACRARTAQKELDERVEAVRTSLRESQGAGGEGGFGAAGGEGMDFDDEKMRKSGRMKKGVVTFSSQESAGFVRVVWPVSMRSPFGG